MMSVLNFTISLNQEKPYYIQIYQALSTKINTGSLKSNEKLPSKRLLAKNLNVSVNTIVNAYNLLLEEGYIISKEKKGYFVSEQLSLTTIKPLKKEYKNPATIFQYDLTTRNTKDIDFSYTSFTKCAKQVLSTSNYLKIAPLEGISELRLSIASHLEENRGMTVNYSHIIIGSGLELLTMLFKILPFSSYALENPGYHKLATLLNNNNLECEYVGLDRYGCLIPKSSQVLYTTPFNQFPTGIKMSINRKKELINWANNINGYIIEDDFDAEFRINGAPTTSLHSLSPERVIFFSSFSTTVFSGFRTSFMILPDELLNRFKETYHKYSNPVSTLDQHILAEFINSGSYARHINRLKSKYLKKREIILNFFKDNKYVKISSKINYLSMILELNHAIDVELLKLDLARFSIDIKGIDDYDAQNSKSNYLLIGYTNIDDNSLAKALNIINDLIIKQIKRP